MRLSKENRQVPINHRLQPCAEIMLGKMSLARLIGSVWDRSAQMGQALMIHKDFVVTSELQQVHLVSLGWNAFEGTISASEIDRLLDREYLANWSKRELDGQRIEPCEDEDIVQLFAQCIIQVPLDKEDMFGVHRPWSSMKPLPNPFGKRFFIAGTSDSTPPRALSANNYGVGNVEVSNIFHSSFGSILYRLVET